MAEKIKAKMFVEKYFQYKHLAPQLQDASKPFTSLAGIIANAEVTDEEQREIALQKLLEAKDCFVRSCIMVYKESGSIGELKSNIGESKSKLDSVPQEEVDKIKLTVCNEGRD